MGLLVQGIVSGIAHGAIYALVALGYSIIFSTMRMGHFAQGDFFMFGAFAGFQFIVRMNCPVVVSVFMSMAWTAALMLVVERVVYRPMYAKGGGNIFILILTLAMQYIVQGVVQIIWGYEAKKMPPMFGSENKTYDFFGTSI